MTTVNITTPPITRAELMTVFGGNDKIVRAFEKLLNDVRTNIPDAVAQIAGVETAPFVLASASPLTPNGKVLTAGGGVTLTPSGSALVVGLITPLPVNLGGTGAVTAGQALLNLGGVTSAQAAAAAPVQSVFGRIGAVTAQTGDYTAAQVTGAAHSGANTDITSIGGLTTALSVGQGGTGLATLAQYNVLCGNAASNVSLVAPGATGTLFASNGASAYASFQTKAALSIAASGANSDITSLSALGATGIVGVTNGGDATAGSVGEYLAGSTGGTTLTSGTTVNATSLGLTAGDWDVWGQALFLPTASDAIVGIAAGIATVSATLPASPDTTYFGVALTVGTGGATALNALPRRISVASNTTVYLVAEASSVTGGSGATVNGYIRARRRR